MMSFLWLMKILMIGLKHPNVEIKWETMMKKWMKIKKDKLLSNEEHEEDEDEEKPSGEEEEDEEKSSIGYREIEEHSSDDESVEMTDSTQNNDRFSDSNSATRKKC